MRHPAHWTTAACPKLSLGCIWHQFRSRAKPCTAINISHHNVSPSTSPTATIDNAQHQIHASHPLNDDVYTERPSPALASTPGTRKRATSSVDEGATQAKKKKTTRKGDGKGKEGKNGDETGKQQPAKKGKAR